VLRDEQNGEEWSVDASWIINATGPWADMLCQSSGVHTDEPMVGGVRGSHIVLPKFVGAPDAAVYTEAVDGRPIFVLPWNDQILLGTTEVRDDSDPSRVRPSDDELGYLLASLHRLFPQLQIARNDVRYAFAGVRPLPYTPKSTPAATTRRHVFHDHAENGASGMLSLIGGKLTTAGAVARECANRMGIATAEFPGVGVVTGNDFEKATQAIISEVAEIAGISRESAAVIHEWYGPRSLEIANKARSNSRLREPLCPHTPHIVAEAADAFDNQCAVTLGDVLLRRVPIALGACWSAECKHVAARQIASAVDWDEKRLGGELEQFEAECESFLQRQALWQRNEPTAR